MATYTVKKGDCPWNIAKKYLGNGRLWTKLCEANGISTTKPKLYVGQVLNLDISGTVDDKKNVSSMATIEFFGLQAGTDSTLFVVWQWDRENTASYKVRWYYDTGDGIWFVGNDSSVEVDKEDPEGENPQATYSAPGNAKRVKFIVKPISETHEVKKKEVSYWTASWSTEKIYDFADSPPSAPGTPTVEIKDLLLRATLDNINDLNATSIQFQVIKDNTTVFKTSNSTIQYADDSTTEGGWVTYTCYVDAGSVYKVRARACRGDVYSEWTAYSSNIGTKPSTPSEIITCRANSETSVYLEWSAVSSAESYDIEYTTDRTYFDNANGTSTQTGIEFTHFEKTGLETGEEYFFRVRAVNKDGKSTWSEIKSVAIGSEPSAPTTWSSTTTAITGEPLNLYWVHNAEDESSQTYAELELIFNGVGEVYTIKNSEDEDEKDKTSSYSIDTSSYDEGTKIQWRVRTAGVTKVYGDWSIQRTVDVYAPPTMVLDAKDADSNVIEQLNGFPFYVSALTGPNTQAPISYHLIITSNDVYESVDDIGNVKMVNKGEAVYSKYFDISTSLKVEFSANNINLENNVSYTITCTATMDSGLTVEESVTFKVAWSEISYEPNAEIAIDYDTLTANIKPYCRDENNALIPGVYLSVYRREFDGSFTEIASGIANDSNTFVTDPHPALDYARYRIVATTEATGAVNYCDLSGYPVGETAVIIQWDEDWRSFDTTNEDDLVEPVWSGSLLRLPYNVDVSDNYDVDVSLVEYIGRKRPVSYYGTQLGESATWSVTIPKDDSETLYALRRLAIWTGDVYVREPSGSGYWANLSISFGQKHCDVTIPVSLKITRVEGGM